MYDVFHVFASEKTDDIHTLFDDAETRGGMGMDLGSFGSHHPPPLCIVCCCSPSSNLSSMKIINHHPSVHSKTIPDSFILFIYPANDELYKTIIQNGLHRQQQIPFTLPLIDAGSQTNE